MGHDGNHHGSKICRYPEERDEYHKFCQFSKSQNRVMGQGTNGVVPNKRRRHFKTALKMKTRPVVTIKR